MTLDDACEKFYSAVRTLAIMDRDIKSRLTDAVVNNIAHVNPEKDLPDDLRDKFNRMLEELTTEGSIPETIAYMTNMKASSMAGEVVSLYDELVKENYKAL